ncbi:MAG: NusG domain II-containing protein [Burkholderiales bacterium]
MAKRYEETLINPVCSSTLQFPLAIVVQRFFKPGDWLTLALVCCSVGWLCATLWRHGAGDLVIVRSKGQVVSELSLQRNRTLSVTGPLGATVIEVKDQRVRIVSDPSPRQICVHHGWLKHVGEMALCLPNQVSVEVADARGRVDSVNY